MAINSLVLHFYELWLYVLGLCLVFRISPLGWPMTRFMVMGILVIAPGCFSGAKNGSLGAQVNRDYILM